MCWTSVIVHVSSAPKLRISMLEVKNRLHSRTRVAILRFQNALSGKNWLRSRTRVTTFMFQSALSLKNRFFSRTRVTNSTLNFNKYEIEPKRTLVLRDQNVPSGYKIDIFAKGIFKPFNLPKFCQISLDVWQPLTTKNLSEDNTYSIHTVTVRVFYWDNVGFGRFSIGICSNLFTRNLWATAELHSMRFHEISWVYWQVCVDLSQH